MSDTEEIIANPPPRPELNEDDFDAPFLHETTSPTHVILLLFTLFLTFGLMAYILILA